MQKKTRKTIFAVLATALCASMFTACGGSHTVAFNAFWHKNVNVPNLGTEKLSYNVTFEEDSGLGFGYSVKNATGTYTTTLTAYDSDEGKLTYRYETQLTINIVYEFGDQQAAFDDSVSSVVVFESATESLKPISSEKKIVSHSPANTTATKLEDCYNKYEVEVKSDYKTKKSVVKTTLNDKTDATSTTTATIKSEENYTQVDNEQLFLALRGLNPSAAGSSTLLVYAPFSDAAQQVGVSFSSEKSKNFTFTINAAEQTNEITYYPVTLSLNEKYSGASQSLQIAKAVDPLNNTYRNVILQYEVPMALNLGTLTYTLTQAEFMQ